MPNALIRAAAERLAEEMARADRAEFACVTLAAALRDVDAMLARAQALLARRKEHPIG